MLHHAAIAALCAVLSFLPIHLLRHSALIGGESDDALDTIMRLQSDSANPPLGPGVTILDIGEAEFVRLGRPLMLPHDWLGAMLEKLDDAKARLIILDVDISWPDAPERDAALRRSLTRLKSKPGPAILLVREALPDLDSDAPAYLRPTMFDDLTGVHSRIRFVSAAMMASSEGVVRRMRPWTALCRDGQPVVLPGVHLAAAAAHSSASSVAALDKLDADLDQAKQPCAAGTKPVESLRFAIGDRMRQWNDGNRADRILFRYGWRKGAALSPTSAMAVVPAQPLLENPQEASLDLFRDRIAVVGVSAGAARDTHLSPLGSMPGSMVLANAVRSEIAESPIEEEDWLFGLVLSLVMSAITFVVWLLLRRVLDFNIVLLREGLKLGLTAMWSVVAWIFLAHGAALDFAFPQYIVISYLAYSEGFDKVF